MIPGGAMDVQFMRIADVQATLNARTDGSRRLRTRLGRSHQKETLWPARPSVPRSMSAPDDSLPADPPDSAPPQRICGWCRKEIVPGTQPATYGICHRCFVQLELDARRHEEGRA
jgi:hypothetical protein